MKKLYVCLSLTITLSLLQTACIKKNKAPVSQKKVLNHALESEIKGFDPLFCDDKYTHEVQSQIFEKLFEYHYLKRPYQLQPMLAKKMPEISDDGLTYTIKLRKDVYFQKDPAFGQGEAQSQRKFNAHDVVYTYTRFADPHLKHTSWWILQDQIEGLDEAHEKMKTMTPPIDYKKIKVAGLTALDDRTVQIKLKRKNKQFLYLLAMPNTGIVAHEVVNQYKEDFINHPVGTGPFVLKNWVRNQKFEFVKNPTYRNVFYPKYGEPTDEAQGLLKTANQKLPLVDELVFWVYTERQPMWLNFRKGKLDFSVISKDAYQSVVNKDGSLKQEYVDKNMVLKTGDNLDIVMKVFNMADPVIGKNKPLRKAISASMNREEKIDLFYNGRAYVSHGPIPNGLEGYDPDLKDPNGYNVENAKKWFKEAQALHKKNHGTENIPPLLQDITARSFSRQMAEAMDYELKEIGYSSTTRVGTWPQFSERMKKSQGQFYPYAWNADYPDPENFLQLLYGGNKAPGPNSANFENAEYDKLYLEMKNMPDGQERNAIIGKMVKIIHEECPWVFFIHRKRGMLAQGWLKNYKAHAMNTAPMKYLDIDLEAKNKTLSTL
ncbi:ABC transporter substrate-binding protein [bacterium]|nr:ABC transporter substrate-binding protein [bacterium]